MMVKAAVLRKVNEPYSIEELELAPPKEKEALVQTAMMQDLKLEKLVANKFRLDDLNEVANKMLGRKLRGRWVCAFD